MIMHKNPMSLVAHSLGLGSKYARTIRNGIICLGCHQESQTTCSNRCWGITERGKRGKWETGERMRPEKQGYRGRIKLPGDHKLPPFPLLPGDEPRPWLFFSPSLSFCVPLTSPFHFSVKNEYKFFSDLRSNEIIKNSEALRVCSWDESSHALHCYWLTAPLQNINLKEM